MKAEDRILPLNILRRVAVSHFPCERGDDCPPCDLREHNPSRHHLPVRGWVSRFVAKSRSRVARQARGAVSLRGVLEQYVEGASSESAIAAEVLMNNAG